MILKYILNKIKYPGKKNNLDKMVNNKNNRWLYMVHLHNDAYQIQVDCDGMSNECHVILLYFLPGLIQYYHLYQNVRKLWSSPALRGFFCGGCTFSSRTAYFHMNKKWLAKNCEKNCK